MSDDTAPPRKGRGFPPDAHKYRPGQSGNRKGRPVGAKNKAKQAGAAAGLTANEMAALVESQRPIKMADGTSMPTLEGMHRARNVAAMKGQRLAMKDSLRDIQLAEEKVEKRKIEAFEMALGMKRLGREIIEELKRRGVRKPDVCPHPDDIVIDYSTMEVRYEGPVFEEQQRDLNTGLEALAKLRRSIFALRREVEADPSKESGHYWVVRYTLAYNEMNEQLPERYRKRLPLWPAGRDLPWPQRWVEQWASEGVTGGP